MRQNRTKKEKPSEKTLLKQYLGQYYKAKSKKRQLEIRLRNFREEMSGINGKQHYFSVPAGKTNKISDTPASTAIRAAEIEERIEAQKAEMSAAMLNVMAVMDFLPGNSIERMILEYRHIDCMSWNQLIREVNFSRTTANDYYNEGVKMLLTFKKVRKLIVEYTERK